MQTSSTLNKWLGILFLYWDLMSSVMKLASESKKGETHKPLPFRCYKALQFPLPSSKVITLQRPVHKQSYDSALEKTPSTYKTSCHGLVQCGQRGWEEGTGHPIRCHELSDDNSSSILGHPLASQNMQVSRFFPHAARGKVLPWVFDQGRAQTLAQLQKLCKYLYMQCHRYGSCQCQNLNHDLFKHV